MNFKVQRLVTLTNVAIAVIFILWGIYMVTMPLHPYAGDSHAGFMAVFPGILLLVVAVLTYSTGRLLRRLPGWGGAAEAVVPMIVIIVVLAFALK
jgi:uncharacterized membrane protein